MGRRKVRGRLVAMCVVLVMASIGQAKAGYYLLTYNNQTNSSSQSGTPQGQYGTAASSGNTWGTALAYVTQGSGTASANASGTADWHKIWTWQPQHMGDLPGEYHTRADGDHKGSIKGEVGGCGMMQQPTATAQRIWYANSFSVTANCQTLTFVFDWSTVAFKRQVDFNGAWTIDMDQMVSAGAHADRNAPGTSWGRADAGNSGNVVNEELTAFDLFPGPPDS